MSTRQTGNLLVTIPISHYCERARWALDYAEVTYRESAHLQAIHRYATLRAGGGITAPVFVCAAGALSQSAEILAWADAQAPADRELYPQNPEQAARVRELEVDFAERLGPPARLWLYQRLRDRRDLALAYGCDGIPAWEQATLRITYPLLIGLVARVFDANPATAERSEAEVRAIFDAVGERLSDGRPYLCGERFTAADLTFATMAAPMLVPPDYGIALPQPAELPPVMAAVVDEMRTHPAGVHALAMFATHRH